MTDMSSERIATETSPLLGPQSNGNAPHPPSTGAIAGLREPEAEVGQRNGTADEETQSKDTTEARNQLRYIVPAISIGVCIWPISGFRIACTELLWLRSFSRLRTR